MAAVVLGVVSAVLALDAVSGVGVLRPLAEGPAILRPNDHTSVEFLSGVICGVLAGATFFSGLACFFWNALLGSRRQLAQILESLRAAE